MTTASFVNTWANEKGLDPIHVDCATAVMLKIIDGKCKMNEEEKVLMEVLYDAVKNKPGKLLDGGVHGLIASARGSTDETTLNKIYEERLLAETAISRPVMKGFKAMLRQEGVLERRI